MIRECLNCGAHFSADQPQQHAKIFCSDQCKKKFSARVYAWAKYQIQNGVFTAENAPWAEM